MDTVIAILELVGLVLVALWLIHHLRLGGGLPR